VEIRSVAREYLGQLINRFLYLIDAEIFKTAGGREENDTTQMVK